MTPSSVSFKKARALGEQEGPVNLHQPFYTLSFKGKRKNCFALSGIKARKKRLIDGLINLH
jgi:hypothetical protein